MSLAQTKGMGDPASLSWKRYLQFTSEKENRSLISSKKFFFDSNGASNPEAEMKKSIEILNSDLKVESESGPMPIQCVFPARKALLEKILNQKFPSPDCPELDRWIKEIGGQRIWIIYAGAYRNNPASLFGHTFLRFDKSVDGDPSRSLRSQSVGFLADTPIGEGQTETVFKGLLGFYQGYYNVQPYYMQTALYNNSESRSLWEFELNLMPEEKQWAVLYLWELSERGSMPYWFFDENCSFQLMAFLEAVRPQSHLTAESGIFVLPLETVRLLQEKNMLVESEPVYQASIRTRMQERLRRMTPQQKILFRKARRDISVLSGLQDQEVLDALTEYQTYYNYQKQARLSKDERLVFEKTFQQRASLSVPSKDVELTRKFESPLKSHEPSFLQISGSNDSFEIQSLMGAHDWTSSIQGLEDVSTIEYMGFRARRNYQDSSWQNYSWLLARARTFNDFTSEEPSWSWAVDGSYEEFREGADWVRGINTGGGGGLSWVSWTRRWAGGIFLQARLEPHSFVDLYQIGWGPQLFLRFENESSVWSAESSLIYWGTAKTVRHQFQAMWKLSSSRNLRPSVIWSQNESQISSSYRKSVEDLEVAIRYYY